MTTPSFDDEDLWGPLFPALKQHMKDSPFWQHLADLEAQAAELEALCAEAAVALEDESFREEWERLSPKPGWQFEVSRDPAFADTLKYVHPAYPADFTERALDSFQRRGYPVYERLWRLVRGLQALQDDLLPERVELLIAAGERLHSPEEEPL